MSQGDGDPRLAARPAGRVCRRRPVVRGSRRSSASISRDVGAGGPGGRITEDDVAPPPARAAKGRREPLRGVRRVIAEHMARAHREVPPVTWVEECDFEDVPLERLLPTVVKACADSLVEFPELNARLDGDAIVYLDRYDIGVAVQTDDGLVVPVVRGANEKSVDELAAEIADLAERARAGSLAADELRGSTFTVTSAGKLAGLFQTPIVNHPEVAILSIGRVAPGRSCGTARSWFADRNRRDHVRPPRRRRRARGVRPRGHRRSRRGGLSRPFHPPRLVAWLRR